MAIEFEFTVGKGFHFATAFAERFDMVVHHDIVFSQWPVLIFSGKPKFGVMELDITHVFAHTGFIKIVQT